MPVFVNDDTGTPMTQLFGRIAAQYRTEGTLTPQEMESLGINTPKARERHREEYERVAWLREVTRKQLRRLTI